MNSSDYNMAKDEAAVGMAEEEDMNSIIGFEAMEEDIININNQEAEKDLWLDDVNEFYNDFPPLPADFPCMSSSSSSSSAPGPTKTTSSSSACSSSWAVLKSDDAEEDTAPRTNNHNHNHNHNLHPIKPSSSTSMENPMMSDIDCIDVMENFGYMDLIDGNDLWDPSSVFQSENPQDQLILQPTPTPPPQVQEQEQDETGGADGPFSFLQGNSELATIFFEWLKQNKDCISAEDVRSIKLKRSTIESASKRLGSTKEGKKQLLKLILEWVEQYQLQKKRLREGGPQSPYTYQESFPNSSSPNTNFTNNLPAPPPDPNTCFDSSPWLPPDAMVGGPPQPAFQPPMVRYGSIDPYTNTMLMPPANQVVNGIPYQHSSEYPMMDHPQGWAQPFPMGTPQYSPFPDNGNILHNHQHAVYGHPYQSFDPNGERLMRLGSSATKEARKKRMARQQRRLYSHHHRHNSNSIQNHGQIDDPTAIEDAGEDGANSPGNWVYWSQGSASANPPAGMIPPVDSSQQQYTSERAPVQPMNCQRLSLSDRRQQQGWKTEKNLKFLLQKVLKQSDVGNLGRIVLPKKEAENHLPELESRDGIPIAMEDIGSSRVWNMRYRFWPNNKSRMYLLENTGDFVRVNGLQEGDFIVIYSDTKCGKYMIRGVKVRQPGQKLDSKKGTRRNARNMSFAGNSSSHAPIKQSVR